MKPKIMKKQFDFRSNLSTIDVLSEITEKLESTQTNTSGIIFWIYGFLYSRS